MKKLILLFCVISIISVQKIYSWGLISNPECVVYDSIYNRYLVSCLPLGRIVAIDSNGNQTIFKSGLGTAFSSTIYQGVIYLSSSNKYVRGFSLADGSMVCNLYIPAAHMLDGMTTDTSGNLYVVDYHYGGPDDAIFKIRLSDLYYYKIATPASGLSPDPQDLLFDVPNNRLLIVFASNTAPVQALSLADTSVNTILNSTPGIIDGIEMDNTGNYFLTSWSAGALLKYDHNFANPPQYIISGLNGPSNLGYNRVKNILAVPVYNSDTIIFLDLSQVGIKLNSNEVVSEFRLHQNYPNPFNPSTVIKFDIVKSGTVKLEIYNTAGVLIETPVSSNLKTGSYEFIWNASGYSSGTYFYRLTADGHSSSGKMVLLK